MSIVTINQKEFRVESGKNYSLDVELLNLAPDSATKPATWKNAVPYGDIRDYFSDDDIKKHERGEEVEADGYLKRAIFDKLDFLLDARKYRTVNAGAINPGWDNTNNIFCEPIKFPAGMFIFRDNHWLTAPISLAGSAGFNTVFKYLGMTDFISVIGHFAYKREIFQATRGEISNIKIISVGSMERNACLINRVGVLHNHWIEKCHLTMFGDPAGWSRMIGASKIKDYKLKERFLAYGFGDFTLPVIDGKKVEDHDSWQLESYTVNNHIEGGNVGIEIIGRNCLVAGNATDYCEVAFFSPNLQKSRVDNNIFSGEGEDPKQKTLAGILISGFGNTFRNTILSYDVGIYTQGYDNNFYGEDYTDVTTTRGTFFTMPFDLRDWKKGEVRTATKGGLKKYYERSHIKV
jgi:hypothetical protein